MLNKFFSLFCGLVFSATSWGQSITVLDNSIATNNGSWNPIQIDYDYSYTQTIYRKSDIQGSGTVTALQYYFAGNSLDNSDSLIVYMGNTSWDYFDVLGSSPLVPRSRMDSVFKGKMSYTTLPGTVTITLNKPFIYNSDSNIVVAICDIDPGYNLPSATNISFVGYDNNNFGSNLNRNVTSSYVDLNPMSPAYVETHTSQYLGGDGGVPKITLVGLSPFQCKSPKQVHVTNITHNQAKVMWSPPLATTPTYYDIYYSTNPVKPVKSTLPKAQVNVPDTQAVITNLSADTMNYVWVRSRCGGADTSVWTYTDSFHTICAPMPIPTAIEQFTNAIGFDSWLPHCWTRAYGYLTSNSQLGYDDDPYSSNPPWYNREWLNQSGSTNFAEFGFLSGTRETWLVSPSYDLGTSGNKNLEFDMALTKNNNSQQGTLDTDDRFAVIISTDNGIMWSNANILQQWIYPQTISGAGQHVTIPLTSYSGVIRISFYVGSAGGTIVKNLFVDNVQITGIMPVTLTEFIGNQEGNANLLQWHTATEQNNKGFELQRSTNGNEFSSIGFIPTQARSGNSNNILSYHFTDKQPLSGNNYYRLKQIDFDGHSTLSNIVLIKRDKDNQLYIANIYPNPTPQQLNVALFAPTAQKVQLIITDMAGKTVQQKTVQLQAGDNTTKVNVATLHSGTYFIKAICSNGCNSSVNKFIKE